MTNTQEIKTVSYGEYKRELYKLQEKYEGYDSHISIFESNNTYEGSTIQVSVNWAATGTVSPEETEEFAHALLKAAEDCRNFKYNGYVIDWATPSERNH